jgi:hypothetical protein
VVVLAVLVLVLVLVLLLSLVSTSFRSGSACNDTSTYWVGTADGRWAGANAGADANADAVGRTDGGRRGEMNETR